MTYLKHMHLHWPYLNLHWTYVFFGNVIFWWMEVVGWNSQQKSMQVWFVTCWLRFCGSSWHMSSAKALTKELLASQTFLVGLHSLPSYGDIEGKPAMVLLQVIDNLSSDEAAGILQLLDEQIGLNQIEKGQGCTSASKTIACGHKDYFLK